MASLLLWSALAEGVHRFHACLQKPAGPEEHALQVTAATEVIPALIVAPNTKAHSRGKPYLVTSPVSLVSIWSPVRPTTTCPNSQPVSVTAGADC